MESALCVSGNELPSCDEGRVWVGHYFPSRRLPVTQRYTSKDTQIIQENINGVPSLSRPSAFTKIKSAALEHEDTAVRARNKHRLVERAAHSLLQHMKRHQQHSVVYHREELPSASKLLYAQSTRTPREEDEVYLEYIRERDAIKRRKDKKAIVNDRSLVKATK